MSQLKDNCNKEIFIVYNEEENNNRYSTEIYITSEFMELTEYIRKLVPSLDFGTKILHGILTSATILPKNLKGKTPFIIVDSVSILDHASISESNAQSDEDLVEAINLLLHDNKTKIEDIYILYGYEISTVLALNDEELDDEIIDACQKIVNNINTIKLLVDD